MAIKVAIIEDNKDLRLGASYVLKSSPAFEVTGAYETAEDFFYEVNEKMPDVVLMDIELPGIDGITATAALKKEFPRVQIVILSVYEDDDNVFKALCAGACGYVTKPVMPAEMLSVAEQAFGGSSPMSPHIARKVLNMFLQYVPPPSADYNLTPRELEVLDLLIQGYDNNKIAGKLYLSTYTIRAHIRNIYDKLHVHSKSQAVAKALKEGVVIKKT